MRLQNSLAKLSSSGPASADLDAAFAALSDPTRRAILARLAQGETRVGDLVKPFAISGPAISRHLRVLESARLIERKVDAQWRVCRLNPPGLQVASDWLAQYRAYWEDRLDQLAAVLEQEVDSAAGNPGHRPKNLSVTRPAGRPAARRAIRSPVRPTVRPTDQALPSKKRKPQ